MKALLLLPLLCLPAFAAPPALSPRHASQPKSTPMVRTVTAPLTEPAPTFWVTVTNRINFSGCNTNDPTCELWFGQYVGFVQDPGIEVSLYFADTVNATQWAWAARFGAGPVSRISEFTWFQPDSQRPPARFWLRRIVVPILPASAGQEPVNIKSPALVNATVTSRKK